MAEYGDTKARVKDYQKSQVAGTLKPTVPLPFRGSSTKQKDFAGNDKGQMVEKVLPFNMVSDTHFST